MDADRIIKEYGIDTEHTKEFSVKGLKRSTRIFRVEKPRLIRDLYIIDTPEGRRISCHPHIFGKELKRLSFSAAKEAAKAIAALVLSRKDKGSGIVFEHVLRAAPGYQLLPALRSVLVGVDIPEVFIRPRYTEKSYRDHVSRTLETEYKDFSRLPAGKDIVLIKPDTEATGASGELSIEETVSACAKVGSRVSDIVLYGFIAVSALKLLKKAADKHGIRLHAFAISDITELAFNNYDMTIYGVDESYFSKYGRIKRLGSIIDGSTLRDCLPEFVPGCDQPGDWSSRQESLFTGRAYEEGDISEHLEKSRRMIDSLRKVSGYEAWQDRIAKKELMELESAIEKHGGAERCQR